jgi:GT2 family glycosyltransferase
VNVSIIIPCYDQGDYLGEAIESVLAQTHPCSVIVVDDGSRDNSAKVASRYPAQLIRQRNRGLSAARNAGISAACTRWVLPLDADDRLEPCAVASMIGLDQIVSPSVQMFGAIDSTWVPPLAHPTLRDFLKANHSIAAGLYLREVWETIGGYDEAMRSGAEDYDFWVRALHAGYSMTVVADKLLHYRIHPGGTRLDRPSSSQRLRANLQEVRAYQRAKYERMGMCGISF